MDSNNNFLKVIRAGLEGMYIGKYIYSLGKSLMNERETEEGRNQSMIFCGFINAFNRL